LSRQHSQQYLQGLVRELCALPHETEWVEFKLNDAEPAQIGEYVSALSNSAALLSKPYAYLVWGISDISHAVVGTSFVPSTAKVGNEDLENWLLRLLTPRLDARFYEVTVDGRSVVLLEVPRAPDQPVRFRDQEFIRISSYKKKLKEYPEKERALWRMFEHAPFEKGVAAEHVRDEDVLRLLDYPAYFDLLKRPLPGNRSGILSALLDDGLVARCAAGSWDILNLGALLFAKRLTDFPGLQRKAARVIEYQGTSRINTLREQEGAKGYASGFEGLVSFINGLLPSNEVIGQALRRTVAMFPELAVRELVANALIHQNLFASGTGPKVEVFTDRMEITNPGTPLVDTQRFVDAPPKSRNESLASLVRRIGICEERGSGWDKIAFQIELFQLPAPLIEVSEEHTRVVLFAHRPLLKMDRADRVRAVYLHACLRYVNQERMTNASVRERFGIERHNSATASRLIREAVEARLVVPYDSEAGRKFMRYVPFWAVPE